METAVHSIDWFEIPARDIDRAQRFYETLIGSPMHRETIAGQTLAIFDHASTGVGGCVIAGSNAPAPSTSGTLVYLCARPSLDAALARLEQAGGRVLTPKVQLPGDMGCYAHVADSEGTRVGLHALT
jgi:predicted enzyme related to lactoylglutathione lyase